MPDNPSLVLGKHTTKAWQDCSVDFYKLDMDLWYYIKTLPSEDRRPFVEAWNTLRFMAEKLSAEDTKISNNYSNVVHVEFGP